MSKNLGPEYMSFEYSKSAFEQCISSALQIIRLDKHKNFCKIY